MFASLDLHNQTIIDQNILEDEKILVIKCWKQDLNNKLSSISEGKIEKNHFKVCELILRYRVNIARPSHEASNATIL